MRRLWVSLLLLGFCVPAHPQDAKPYLRIETGSHSAKTYRIDVDAAERFLVSASDDKTARVWDLHSRELLQILRPPIGDFSEGRLYAVAISPDGNTVAVGGFTGANGSGNYPIYIFDRAHGTIRNVISGLPSNTNHLAYSRNGRNLAAALGSNHGIRIYETQDYNEVARDTHYGDTSYWVEFDNTGRLVSTSYDGYVRLYGSDFRLITKTKPPGGKQPFSARFSPDGTYAAVGFDDSSRVDVLLSKDLAFQYRVQAPSAGRDISTVSWSQDGRSLCAAGRYDVSSVVPALCWTDAGKGKRSSFPVAGTTVMELRALRNGGMAFAVADGTVGILSPRGAVEWREAPEVLDYRVGASFPRLSSDGNSVESRGDYFNGTEWTNHTIRFSVQERKLEIDPQANSSISHPLQEGLAISHWENNDSPTLNGTTLKLETYELSRSLAIAPKQDSFVLGADWNIYRFDRQDTQVWKTSVPGGAWGVSISSDGRYVVATLRDGTVRWYTYDKGEEVLALFVDRDLQRWVAWTPDGFFTFDNGGDALIGYQINRGPDHVGDFVKVDQLREVFYRPDLISQILRPGGVEAVVAERRRIAGDWSKPLVDKLLSGGPLPEIELLSPAEAEVDGGEYRLEFRVQNAKADLNKIVVRYDGSPIDISSFRGGNFDISGTANNKIVHTIPVRSGWHNVTVSAKDANGVEGAPSRTIRLKGRDLASSSNLYIVAAGISHYFDPAMNKGVSFATADADMVTDTFKKQEGKGLFQKVFPNQVPLLDSRATAKNISDAVANVASHIQPGDTFVLYLAGHGVALEGEYYFIPWVEKYSSTQELLSKSLNRLAIQNLLGQVKLHTPKIVLILDTCGASAVMGGADAEKETAAMSRVSNISNYPVLAASSANAIEGYENHGLFTSILVEGLYNAQADPQGDILTTRLGEYTQTWVPKIAEQKLHAVQKPVTNFFGEPFPLAHKTNN
jgi:WD40 repeat protein